MNSETWCFEDDKNNKHIVFIPKTGSMDEFLAVTDAARALVRTHPWYKKFTKMRTISHSGNYENELRPYSTSYLLLDGVDIRNLTPLQKDIILVQREGFEAIEVCDALGIKKD